VKLVKLYELQAPAAEQVDAPSIKEQYTGVLELSRIP
jgi:hypothetical protein